MATRLQFHGTAAEARRVVRQFVGMLTGREPDHGRLARSVFLVIGMTALSDIQQDFIRKSRGGVGEDGVQWPPLSKEYLAYGRRFGPGEQQALKSAAGLGRANQHGVGGKGGLLTKDQQNRWNQIFAMTLARLAASLPFEQAKGIAAGHAWNVIKREGAKTKLEVYGNRQVEMLRDTGVLFNSLSPGHMSDGGDYTPPSSEGGNQQIFKAIENGIIVGTDVPYAGAQNKKRVFLPKQIPDVWAARWTRATVGAIVKGLRMFFFDQGGQAA